MSILGKRIVVTLLVALLLAAAGWGLAGAGFARAADNGPTPSISAEPVASVVAPAAQPTPPSMESLRAIADYVSPDGRYVKIGPVEISTTQVVTRDTVTP